MIWKLNNSIKTDAGMVAYGIAGNGPDLVLAHGWPWSSYSWHKVIPELANHFRVHWYDMPGYGQSEKSAEQRTSLDIQGQIFAEMLAYWGLVKPLVVAHDFGGAATLRAHLLLGCDFSRYVLMNVVAVRPWGSDFFSHVGRHVDAFTGVPQHIHKAIVRAYIEGALVNELDDGVIHSLISPWLSDEGKASFYRQFAQADEKYTAEIEPDYEKVRCPVGIVWREDDPWIPLARGQSLHSLIPHASFQTIAKAGHLPQLEAPDQVAAQLIKILSG